MKITKVDCLLLRPLDEGWTGTPDGIGRELRTKGASFQRIPHECGERICGRWQCNRCFQEGAVQVAQPDLGNCGGITEVKKICDLAYIYESSVQVHVCGSPLVTAASLHVEAAIPNFQIHEYNVNTMLPEMLKCAKYNYQPVGGYYEIPELPGISYEISDWAYGESEIATIGG